MNKRELINLHQLLELVVTESKKDKYNGEINVNLDDREVKGNQIHKTVNQQQDALLDLAQKIGKELDNMDFDEEQGVTEEEIKRTCQEVTNMPKDKRESVGDQVFTQYQG